MQPIHSCIIYAEHDFASMAGPAHDQEMCTHIESGVLICEVLQDGADAFPRAFRDPFPECNAQGESIKSFKNKLTIRQTLPMTYSNATIYIPYTMVGLGVGRTRRGGAQDGSLSAVEQCSCHNAVGMQTMPPQGHASRGRGPQRI